MTGPRDSRVQLRSLLSALAELAAEQSVPGRVDQLLQLSVQAVDADYAVLAVDGLDGRVDPVLFSTGDEAAVEELRRLLRLHLSAPTARTGPLFHAEAVAVAADTPPELQRPVLEVSMTVASGRMGRLFVLGRRGGGAFAPGDAELLVEFAKMGALAVENALHNREAEQQVKWLRGLTLITQALLRAGTDEIAVWQEIADRVHQLARARTVTISTPSEDDPELLEVRVAAGVGADELPGLTYARAHSLPAHAMATRTWQVGSERHRRTSHTETGPPIGPTLAIPLLSGDSARGAVVLSRHRDQPPFDRSDIVMAHDFADQAMLAVELAETRAAEQRLVARTAVEEVGETFQDQTIQRLFAVSLSVEAALASRPEPWLALLHTELAAIIADARSSLDTQYGRVT